MRGIFALVIFLVVGTGSFGQPGLPQRHSFTFIQQQFKNPKSEFGSAPLWVWNTRITHSLIDSMLSDFKRQGFGGVFIHPRPGLITPYLSTEWFSEWKYAMEKAKQVEMDVWIYDENSYPSGFAGGHVQNAMPESYNQGQMLRMRKQKRISISPIDTSFIILQQQTDGSFSDFRKNPAPSEGEFYLFDKAFYYTSAWYGGFSYVDLMVPGVTEKFLDVTMREGYERFVGNEFGKMIKGIFSDEPNIEVWDTISIRWTPLLFPAFSKRWNYDLQLHLPSLFEEVGDWKKVRHDYFAVLLDLFIEHWSKPMHRYAEEKGLEWTGHYWEHEWPNALHVPDNMAMYAWHQRPGIDMLFNQFNEDAPYTQFGNIRAVKELSSVANQLGKLRTLSETYGGAGWELTFKDMKRLGDWEFVLGVNTLNQHLSYMSMEGARKYDYPQSFSYQNPWWPYYRELNLHFARLSLALSTGRQRNDVLVLEPTTTSWMYYTYTHSAPQLSKLANDFQAFVTHLERRQVEYDLGSEDIIAKNGRVDSNRLIVGQVSYQTVIIPIGMENIDSASFQLLKQFAIAGGRVMAFEDLRFLDGRENEELRKWASTRRVESLNDELISKELLGTAFKLKSTLPGGKLYHHRRMLADGQLLFLVNSSIDSSSTGQFRIKGKGVKLLNTMNGDLSDYFSSKDGEFIDVDYTIPPAGSLLFFIANNSTRSILLPKKLSITKNEIKLAPLQIDRIRPNVLNVDFCDLVLRDTVLKDQYFFQATDFLFKRNGFGDGNPWNTSVQFRDQTIRRDTFKANTRFSVDYHFNVTAEKIAPLKLRMVLERDSLWEVFINNKRVRKIPGAQWMDRTFALFDIGQHVTRGRNTISIRAARMSVFSEIEPIYIIGDMGLKEDSVAWSIDSPQPLSIGSWKKQQMPLYGHEVSYKCEFKADQNNKHYTVNPGQWKGTVAILKVNGRRVSILMGNESSVDISPFVKPGRNTIELVVTGSLKNTLGPFYDKPAPGMVSPWHFRFVYKRLKPADYDLMEYGLLQPFQVFAN